MLAVWAVVMVACRAPSGGSGEAPATTEDTASSASTSSPLGSGFEVSIVEDLDPLGVAAGSVQSHAIASSRADGRTLYLWDDVTPGEADEVRMRILGPDGADVAPPTTGAFTPFTPTKPNATPSEAGWWVVRATKFDVTLGEIGPDGALIREPLVVNEPADILPGEGYPEVTVLPGGPLVLWYEETASSPRGHYYVRSFDAATGALGEQVLLATSEEAGDPADVAALPDGGFVAAWREHTTTDSSIHLGWFDADGTPREVVRADVPGLPIQTQMGVSRPDLDVDPAGRAAVAWRSQDLQQDGQGCWARFYDVDRAPLTDPIALGVRHELANRAVVAVQGDVAVFTWEEPHASDVYVQAWSFATLAPLTDPFPVDGTAGVDAQRPALDLWDDGDRLVIPMSWELPDVDPWAVRATLAFER